MALMGLRGIRMTLPIGSDPRHQSAGFTLLELLTIILIMAVLVGVSVPRFRRTFVHLQLQVFANNVVRLLSYASKRAVTRQEVLRVHFDVEGRQYWLAQAKESLLEGESERIASKFNRISSVPEAISLDPSASAVTFYPDGRADRFEMVIFTNEPGGYRLVTDVWTGRAKLLETDGR